MINEYIERIEKAIQIATIEKGHKLNEVIFSIHTEKQWYNGLYVAVLGKQ
jgi:hypothetical protein